MSDLTQFIVLPQTGIQICRHFTVDLHDDGPSIMTAAKKLAQGQRDDALLRLVRDQVACDDIGYAEKSDWIRCDRNEFMFFRLTKAITPNGHRYALDILVDTHNGAGAQLTNLTKIAISSSFWRGRKEIASIFVTPHGKTENRAGSLIIDFGNNGCCTIFQPDSSDPSIVKVQHPFDRNYRDESIRPLGERNVMLSNMFCLRASNESADVPWFVMGARAEELVRENPDKSYLYAPKKYVRDWGDPRFEPTFPIRGIVGQKAGLHPATQYVKHAIDELITHILATLTNPNGVNHHPEFYPDIHRVMITYPLTWRDCDLAVFKRLVEEVCRERLHLSNAVKDRFKVEWACSEPVAVAAYVMREMLFHLGSSNLPLLSSLMGNSDGTPELRLLVLDIGGGSTDVALVELDWESEVGRYDIDVKYQLVESMRFNRAGDRISHILAAALLEFVQQKYGKTLDLSFERAAVKADFNRPEKRQVVAKITAIAESIKRHLTTQAEPWRLSKEDEKALKQLWQFGEAENPALGLEISNDLLQTWALEDKQDLALKDGFADIFIYLDELRRHLTAQGPARLPHAVILSGRTTRLSFIAAEAAQAMRLPSHRILTLNDITPSDLGGHNREPNLDKLAVVLGAQRFRFGNNIRFYQKPAAKIFNRYIGTMIETPAGYKLNPPTISIRPNEPAPRTITIQLHPGRDLKIGHAFRDRGGAQAIANLSTPAGADGEAPFDVEVDILDDFTAKLKETTETKKRGVVLSQWTPISDDLTADNFHDTGEIDEEPYGFLREKIRQSQRRWLVG